MLAGNLLKKPLAEFKWCKIVTAFLITVVTSVIYLKFSLGNSFYDAVLRTPVLYIISGVCGLYFVMGIAQLISWKWPAKIGENALTIMGTHQLGAVYRSGKQQPALDARCNLPDHRRRSGSDSRCEPRLPSAGWEKKKGAF